MLCSSNSLGLFVSLVAVLVPVLAPCSLAQFASPRSANLTTIASPVDPGITISYKVPDGACTTAFDSQQQFTGWVNVPGRFPTNVFFWFVAARVPTSALTIWLNGGPGSSSMFGLFAENGPCEVVERGANRLGTAARDWGWDRASNMLFIDQPNQVGFSYDTPTNGSVDLVSGEAVAPPRPLPSDRPPPAFLNGTFASLNPNNTANTTKIAAGAVWHMLQGFLGTFPQYNPPGNTSVGVNLFAESYGGRYGPVFFETWEEQNSKRRNGTLSNSTLDIHLVSLGIVNGCVDDLVQGPYYTAMAVNNTYGLSLLSPVRAGLANATFYQAGGCQDLTTQCRNATASPAPTDPSLIASINSLCRAATNACNALTEPYSESGRSLYDMAHQAPETFPPSFYIEYLNTRSVQEAIGSVVNYTDNSNSVYSAFQTMGDWERDATVPKLAGLLTRGVRIGLVYGDRDYICNWLGGEAVSLSVASTTGGVYGVGFPNSGYAPIIVNDSYIGGVVRQFGNLSFSRIYQAGHFVPAYQPETAFQVFARIIMGTSVSTGASVNLTSFNTTGPLNATSSLALPTSPTAGPCFVRVMYSACPADAIQSILDSEGVIINGAWYSASSNWPGATSTSPTTGATSTSPAVTSPLTGLFTATATPQSAAPRSAAPIERTTIMAILLFATVLVTL
ncbi:Alpha/Beta hydrolase protein [Podospora appendiculata]|uniref:Alpha/Beta hydrolase protein n=1 Tax=Podospora appendiculata TaxID=314037 RepID=A0AAE0X137_9PEZI|nr:Alpha/Beta hydrolase protein [Podospora appendiculata]